MTALTTNDLSPLAQTYLGVLAVGLVPADLAHEARFRMEHVCAVTHALVQGLAADTYLDAEPFTAMPDFQQKLREQLVDLDQKQIIGVGPAQELAIMRPGIERPDAFYGTVDINRHPPIFDRYLSQRCMELVMANEAAHQFLIELYADSGDVWRELYKQGYGQ